jgi:hypothetical protein
LSTGFILKPSLVTEAFYRGCRSKNLYYLSDAMQDAEIDNLNLADVKLKHLDIRKSVKYKWLRQIEFTGYLFFSMIIHLVMLVAGKTLLIAEWIKNKLTGKKKIT